MFRSAEDARRDQIARIAAHSLIDGHSPSSAMRPNREDANAPNNSHASAESSVSLPQLPIYSINSVGADNCLTEGVEIQGKISPVRRFFCLFVTFDFLFTTLLWLICIVLTGNAGDWKINILIQIKHFTIYTSLFDVVMASACRTVFLLVSYALFRIQHWWMVAITTAASSAFLVAKVFLYEWQAKENENNYTFSVILVLCSFIIAWGETWFLDFKVLPQENRAREILAGAASERTPLLQPNVREPFEQASGYDTVPFYSPIQSAAGSDDEEENQDYVPRRNLLLTTDEEKGYKRKGKTVLDLSWNVLNSPDWTEEKKTQNGDFVYSKTLPDIGKIFKITALLDIKPKMLLNELYYKIESISKWNPTVKQCKILYTIDDFTDITYQISADGGNRLVSSRDFVSLRHWGMKGDCYISAGVSIKHPKMPETKKYVRGENGLAAWVMEPVQGQPRKCTFHWLLNTDLKGWIPQYIIDQALSSIMISYIHHLRSYAATLRLEESSA